MTWTEAASLLTAIASLIAAGVGVWNARKIEVVRHATNSLTEQLVKATGEREYAAGRKDEKEGIA